MIYKNISKNSFKSYKSRLQGIEDQIEELCTQNGFIIDRERFYDETLAININPEDKDGFGGNISLQFIDEPGPAKFRLDLIKTFDIDNIRHFHKELIKAKQDLSFFESDIKTLLQEAFGVYGKLRFEDLELKVEMPVRYT